ncbi:hypothetical protein [Piscinibacter sp.]|jgi:hypothetical protein|uniref:hypothetical protein n=1 Tax=Piscinibacter sp. TaxID=1903157 RepID=UPI001D61E4D7|nr:hypothetical protein [Piscinibacter sp.]MBK7532285.1 hypothetical protein [Piscinibacter sp.]HOX68983.1 hypothetical protein [Burkholderiaceae bacterium]
MNYLEAFPIPTHLLPPSLRALLSPVGLDPLEHVEVSAMRQSDDDDVGSETLHLLMALVPEEDVEKLGVLNEAGDGVVAQSVPRLAKKGDSKEVVPSVSGYDYVVASWGDGSFYTYSLAEKVWMTLGLTPRCLGNDQQRLVYDDLGLPEFGLADGEISAEFHWSASRPVSWHMSNEYLRKYLWMRGAIGVRVFYYRTLLVDRPEIRGLMGGQSHASIDAAGKWCDLDIQEAEGGLLLQMWASVAAVSCELCPEQSAEGLVWPGIDGPMTRDRANATLHGGVVHLDDRFLERYEQSVFYDSTPSRRGDSNPSYRGQWSFTDCKRVGRNLVRVSIRELYKPKPDREIVHAHKFVVDPALVAGRDLNEEHIVSKTQRFVEQLVLLDEGLLGLAHAVGVNVESNTLFGISRRELDANGWMSYPQLGRLAQVVPLDLAQGAFLSRCKSLHEIWQRIPKGFLRSLLRRAGCPGEALKDLGSLKLLQGLLNIFEELDAHQENADALVSKDEPEGWQRDNQRMAPLFLNNDLRIADAHETLGGALQALQAMGFDIASLNQGYGRAIDFVFDAVTRAFAALNEPLHRVLRR